MSGAMAKVARVNLEIRRAIRTWEAKRFMGIQELGWRGISLHEGIAERKKGLRFREISPLQLFY